MNKFIIFLSFISVIALHILVFLNYKKTKIITLKQESQTKAVSIQLSKLKPMEEIIEPVQKVQEEQVVENVQKVKLPEKKQAIKPIQKVKKEAKKEITKKEPVKEAIEEKNSEEKTLEVSKEIQKTNTNTKNNLPIEKVDAQFEKEIQEYLNSYASKLRQEINKNKNYPSISKRLKEEGKVIISFRVLKSGQFTNIKLLSSSSKERLDKAALNALYDTKQYKAFDIKYISKDFLDFELPLEFKLY